MNRKTISLLCFIVVSTLISCWSSTGDIEYEPPDEGPAGKQLGLAIAILDFSDDKFSIKKFRSDAITEAWLKRGMAQALGEVVTQTSLSHKT